MSNNAEARPGRHIRHEVVKPRQLLPKIEKDERIVNITEWPPAGSTCVSIESLDGKEPAGGLSLIK